MDREWSKIAWIFLVVVVVSFSSRVRAEHDISGKENEQYKKSFQTHVLTHEDNQFLLQLARKALAIYLKEGELITVAPEKISPALRERRGCFVTLNKNGRLRGCIGYLLPRSSLCDCVIENAINAAVHDTRFPAPVSFEELNSVTIEISVLTVPKKLELKNSEDLPNHLVVGRDGLILRRGRHQATYLPQVWKHFPDKESFLNSLCQKGGMTIGCWRDQDTEILTYQAEVFHEQKDWGGLGRK